MGDLSVARIGLKKAEEQWTVTHSPAANVQASASKAAGGANQRHHATGLTASFAAGGTAGAAVQVNLRDGASGAGTVLWSAVLAAPSGQAQTTIVAGVDISGTANTALTLEFAAAGGASTLESVSLAGYTAVW